MSNDLAYQFNLGRNGTSQAERLLDALDKDFVHVDERSIRDMLRFAQSYARELNFFNDRNEVEGDWQGFLRTGESVLNDIDAYLQNPDSFASDENALSFLARPHLVLFLTFLQLLQDFSQKALNDFTERHLSYYYRDILGFQPKSAEADQVHILVDLAKGFKGERFLLAADTAVDGGKDEAGSALIYKTEADLMVNRSQISELRTVFVDKKVDRLSSLDFNRDFMKMLELALGVDDAGNLSPGGILPPPFFLSYSPPLSEAFFKQETAQFLEFGSRQLRMSFASFRKFLRLYSNREADRNEWAKINTELGNIALALSRPAPVISNERDFIGNFTNAAGSNPMDSTFFSTLQSVNNVYELYDELELVLSVLAQNPTTNLAFYQNRRDDLLGFIHTHYYDDPGNISHDSTIRRFQDMMALRLHIMNDWREMLELMEQTGAKGTPVLDLESPDFEQLIMSTYDLQATTLVAFFNQAHPTVDSPLDYYYGLLNMEYYFALNGEEIRQMLKGNDVEAFLTKAHTQKNKYNRRLAFYYQLFSGSNGFDFMLLNALGSPNPGDPVPAIPNGHADLRALYQNELAGVEDANLPTGIVDYIEKTLCLSVDHFRFLMETQLEQEEGPDFSAPIWKWLRVITVLADAEQKIRSIKPVPPPEKATLQGVHALAEAKTNLISQSEDNLSRWETFGSAAMPLANLGFLVSSPLLNLSGGERTITLDLFIDLNSLIQEERDMLENYSQKNSDEIIGDPLEIPWPFSLYLSGEKDWLPVSYTATFPSIIGGNQVDAIRFAISLSKDADPVMGLPADHEDFISSHPVLKLALNDPASYRLFSSINFLNTSLAVDVQELAPAVLRNDQVILKPGAPFEPFGSRPRPGSKFSFAHSELATKKLTEIDLAINWMGLPDFAATYVNYSIANGDRKDRTNFKTSLRMHDKGFARKFMESSTARTEKEIEVFSGGKGTYKLDLADPYIEAGIILPSYKWQETAAVKDNVLSSDRYFYLELGNLDFGHDEYPGLAANKANLLAINITDNKSGITSADLDDYQVNPPYTPQIQSFSISYKAKEELLIDGDGKVESKGNFQLFHLHPFGFKETVETGDAVLARYGNEGELYIGLDQVQPPVDVSFLFQMAEGSADPDIQAPIVLWDYLQGDDWKRLEDKGKILSDTTHGLLNSGIIRLRIPEEADTKHHILPSGLRWLRVTAPINSQGLSDTINIHTQAVLATLQKEGVSASHFSRSLPAESITQLKRRNPSVKGILQPYESFGGRPAEPGERLNMRISERLRHKNRAITIWDYERLVLEKFPLVFRAKCLPGGSGVNPDIGKVEMIVVPDIRGLKLFDPFEPKLPYNVLQEITSYLTELAPPAARIVIKNPVYIQLRIRMTIELYTDYQADAQYYMDELHAGLLRLLAPWAYDEGAELVVGGKFFPSQIIDFVEQQFYVDYIKGFQLLFGEEGNLRPASDLQLQNGLPAPRPDGIWVSAKEHLLDAGGDVGRGIGYLKVEVDLVVG